MALVIVNTVSNICKDLTEVVDTWKNRVHINMDKYNNLKIEKT